MKFLFNQTAVKKASEESIDNYAEAINTVDELVQIYKFLSKYKQYGKVLFVKDSIAKISGLNDATISETIILPRNKIFGIIVEIQKFYKMIVIFNQP